MKTFCFEALFDEVRQRCPPGVLGGPRGGLALRCCRTYMQGPPQNPLAVPFPHPPCLLGSHGCCKRLGGCCRCRAFPHLRRPPRPFGPGLAGLSPSDSFSSSFLLRARLSECMTFCCCLGWRFERFARFEGCRVCLEIFLPDPCPAVTRASSLGTPSPEETSSAVASKGPVRCHGGRDFSSTTVSCWATPWATD